MPEISRDNRIKDLFHEALELDEDARAALLDRASSDDPAIVVEVRILIGAHGRARHFLSESDGEQRAAPELFPAAPLLPSGEAIGDRIGRYELLEVVGEGGFGRVYRARQQEPVVRDVALKVIKAGMDSQQVIARFEAERQALALMAHPAIATVFDAGTTATGRPFFVMELVEGVPITEYCDAHRLTIEQRIDLYRQVCAAVQHAHTKGVIHRDLKPSNVLVTLRDGQAQPKVIDFGIAKATTARLTEKALFTESRQLVGTPEYMSPEQADVNAADVDTRSDVYALGVLLYELLTGATPFDGVRLRSAAFGELQRIIREEDPPKPSTRLSTLDALPSVAAQRGIEPRQLTSNLRGDLDWITLRALEKSRELRYGSAADLAEDLRRHLNHEPVLAGPPAKSYRLRKFVRRNRLVVAAVTAVSMAIVAGAVIATVGMLKARASADREREAAQEAGAVNEFMRMVLTSASPGVLGANARFADVLDAACDMASDRFAGHPMLEAQVRDVLSMAYLRLSLAKQTGEQAALAADLWRQAVGPDDPRTIDADLRVAQSMIQLNQTRAAEKAIDDVLPRIERSLGRKHARWFGAQALRADVLRIRGDFNEAARLLRQLTQEAAEAGVSESAQVALLGSLINTLRLGMNRVDESQQPAALDELERLASDVLVRSQRLGAEGESQMFNAQLNLATVALYRHDFVDTARQCRRLLEDSRDRLGECHTFRTWAMFTLANALKFQGEATEAADWYMRGIDCIRSSEGGDNIVLIAHLAEAQGYLQRDGRWVQAEACCRETIAAIAALGGHTGTFLFESRLAYFISQQPGRSDEAEALFQSLQARNDPLATPEDRDWLAVYDADHLARRGEFERAERLLLGVQASNDIDPRYVSPELPGDLEHQLITLYEAWGKPHK